MVPIPISFEFVETLRQEPKGRVLCMYRLEASGVDLADALAQAVRAAYVHHDRLLDAAIAAQAMYGFDDTAAIQMIESVHAARIPQPGGSDNPALEAARSELGEVLALVCLQERFDVAIPAPRVRYKEATELATRGVDVVGLRRAADGTIEVWLCEVKVSAEKLSPPRVVAVSNHNMLAQLQELSADTDRVVEQLAWLVDKADSIEDAAAVFEAIRRLTKLDGADTEQHLVGALIRPESCAAESDFGPFADDPGPFPGQSAYFCTVSLPDSLDELVQQVSKLARGAPDESEQPQDDGDAVGNTDGEQTES